MVKSAPVSGRDVFIFSIVQTTFTMLRRVMIKTKLTVMNEKSKISNSNTNNMSKALDAVTYIAWC